MAISKIISEILLKRGLSKDQHEFFLNPKYERDSLDPFLLPDMKKAVNRIVKAKKDNEKVVIYGDYDVDGMTASAVLHDAFSNFGINFEIYIPDRFSEGYGLNKEALQGIAKEGATLVVTVDCGSVSVAEVNTANELGLDIVITDHHSIGDDIPKAVAVVNPHRKDSEYSFSDLSGCGVAFKLVQALQKELDGMDKGQEKWLLDLVALGTICDIVPLVGENRMLAYWGLEVIKKTRRLGLKALIAVSGIEPNQIDSRKVGFVLGPRLNASGRLSSAKLALELLITDDSRRALELAQKLDNLNAERRTEQNKIFIQAIEKLGDKIDSIIVVDNENWNEGVVGIVASKLMEKYKKPTFVLSVSDNNVKGSGRSFGDFDLSKAIDNTRKYLERGGGHSAAGGVGLKKENITDWKKALNDFYKSLNLKNQENYLEAKEDVAQNHMGELTLELVNELNKLEPFGMSNSQPVFKLENMKVVYADRIGKEKNHLKITLSDGENKLKFIAFSAHEEWFVDSGSLVNLWVSLELNEWNGNISVEGRIVRLEKVKM